MWNCSAKRSRCSPTPARPSTRGRRSSLAPSRQSSPSSPMPTRSSRSITARTGCLSGDVKGKLFIEMSTVPPEPVASPKKVRANGARLRRMPGRRHRVPARAGQAVRAHGRGAADAARAKPILDQMCRRVVHAGPVGNGARRQARDQHAADDLLAGAGRGARDVPASEHRSGRPAGFPLGNLGAPTVLKQRVPAHRASCKDEPSAVIDLQARGRHQGLSQ